MWCSSRLRTVVVVAALVGGAMACSGETVPMATAPVAVAPVDTATDAAGSSLRLSIPASTSTAPTTASPSTAEPAPSTEPPSTEPPTTEPPTTPAPPATEPPPPPVDLTAVDWANRTYLLPCPTAFPPTEVELVDGAFRGPIGTNGHKLFDVIHGEMGEPRRPVAVVVIGCFGAGAWPSSVLVFDGSGPEPVLLGYAAWVDSFKTSAFSPYLWKAYRMQLADGLLHLEGEGYGPGSAGCCPNLLVSSTVGLAEDGSVVELDHVETPKPPPATVPTTPTPTG